MRMILCCGDQGLLTFDGQWHAAPCPLQSPGLIAADNGRLIAADAAHCQLWNGSALLPISRGAEALLTDGRHALILSGETDCLMQHDLASGQLLMTSPMGFEPQSMCRLSPALLAVGGGACGMVQLVDPAELHITASIRLGGCVQRVACSGGSLYALAAVWEDELHSLLWSIRGGSAVPLLRLPGLPGALCADGMGGLWAASSGTLVHIQCSTRTVDRHISGTGLIRHMACSGGWLCTCDPVLGICRLYAPDGHLIAAHEGDVGQALLVP